MLDDLVEAQAAPAKRPVSSARLGESDDAEGERKASGRFDALDVDQFGDGVGHRSFEPAHFDGECLVGTDAFAEEQTELLGALVDKGEHGSHAAPDHVVRAGGCTDRVGDVAAEPPSHVADEFVEELPFRGEVLIEHRFGAGLGRHGIHRGDLEPLGRKHREGSLNETSSTLGGGKTGCHQPTSRPCSRSSRTAAFTA